MKEFNKTNTITYNLMSFTGFKSLFIFSLLLEGPKTYDEIRERFREHSYLREDVSIDTLRVYLTSLKHSGCVIERMKKSEGSGYKLVSQPFELKISADQVKSLIKIYKIIMKSVDVADLFIYEKFLRKLASYTRNNQLRDAVKKVSVFKKLDLNLIEELIKGSRQNALIRILYDSPNSGQKEIDVIAQDLVLADGKLYLSGVGLEYKQETTYQLERIVKIIDIKPDYKSDIKLKPVTVGYELSIATPNTKLGVQDKIVEIKDDSVIIETQTTNLFAMKRKILEYGPLCTVLYPQEFRDDIINTLKEMKAGYIDG